jgi:hypothetical protein
MTFVTTLNAIRAHQPCPDGWSKLLLNRRAAADKKGHNTALSHAAWEAERAEQARMLREITQREVSHV